MAKKKTIRNKKVTKKPSVKKPASKKLVRKPARKKTTATKPATRKNTVKKAKAAKKSRTTKTSRPTDRSLGRAKIPGSTRLDMLLKHDYEAQQVFGFLKVNTVKELEVHSPKEILDVLTAPVVRTVDKIRKSLAINNRCLTGDERFAIQFQKSLQQRR